MAELHLIAIFLGVSGRVWETTGGLCLKPRCQETKEEEVSSANGRDASNL